MGLMPRLAGSIPPILALLAIFPASAQSVSLPSRVAEEAEVLSQNAIRLLTRETLIQRSIMPSLRFRPRLGSPTERATGPRFRIREVVSEFSFGPLRSSGTPAIIEYRQVVSVDNQPLQSTETALKSLSQSIQAGDERTRKRMIEQFANNGLVDIATDYALILLAFTARAQQAIEFSPLPDCYIGTDRVRAFGWRQKSPEGGVLEFHGSQASHRALQGTIWVRASDGLPLRISAWTEHKDGGNQQIRDDATVDYLMSTHGFLTPASVRHRHVVDGTIMTENLYTYEPFKLFSSSSSITFGEIPETVKK